METDTEGDNDCLNKYISVKRKFKTTTFCVINDKLVTDPNQAEVDISSYYFSIIKFDDDEYMINKINGSSLSTELLDEAFSFA